MKKHMFVFHIDQIQVDLKPYQQQAFMISGNLVGVEVPESTGDVSLWVEVDMFDVPILTIEGAKYIRKELDKYGMEIELNEEEDEFEQVEFDPNWDDHKS